MFCKNCGTKLPKDAQFCTKCGVKIDDNTTKPKSVKGEDGTLKNTPSPKISKKVWGTLVIVIVILVCGGVLLNHISNPKGVWLGNSKADVLDIESGGTGYFDEYGFDPIDASITWKRTGFNTFQIKYTDDGKPAAFDAVLKNGKLVTKDGEDWDAENFEKTNKSVNQAKSAVQSYINPTMNSLIDSPTRHIWLTSYINDGGPDNLKPSKAEISEVYVTQNGKSTVYSIDKNEEPTFKQIKNMTDDEIINYAKSHLEKDINHGKPGHDMPPKKLSDVDGTSQISHGQQIGNYYYTGYADTYDEFGKTTDFVFVRLPVHDKSAQIPCLQL